MKHQTGYKSPIGELTITEEDGYIISIEFQKCSNPSEINDCLNKMIEWLDLYFNGDNPSTDMVAIRLTGTEFQKEVYSILKSIPYGNTLTYGEIAQKIANKRKIKRMSSQAVGNAVGKNPLPILVPCHRVMGSGNDLTGYSGGISKKIFLLKLENSWKEEFYYKRTKHNF